MNRPTFRANATPTVRDWLIHVPGIGTTWAIGPDDVPTNAAALIARTLGCHPDDVDVAITYPSNPAAEESA